MRRNDADLDPAERSGLPLRLATSLVIGLAAIGNPRITAMPVAAIFPALGCESITVRGRGTSRAKPGCLDDPLNRLSLGARVTCEPRQIRQTEHRG